LIVEDNSDIRDLLALTVQITGYLPVLASDGKDGVEKANQDKPDLILMDMMMPVMDGCEAARALRASRKTKNIPILATTAWFVLRISSRVWTRDVTATLSSRLTVWTPA
jgi:CheY-like chemotaxis protein